MRLSKISYYLSSLGILVRELKNPWCMFRLAQGQTSICYLKNGMSFQLRSLLDLLVLKETVYDDFYRLRGGGDMKVIVDVGAAYGDFSIYASKLHPEARVYAFEPDKDSCSLLKENCFMNHSAHIKIFNNAIGKHAEYASNASGVKTHLISGKGVRGRKLSDVVPGAIDMLKIDTEGAEMDVLESIKEGHFSKIRFISLEYHNHIIQNSNSLLKTFLEAKGYSCVVQEDPYNPSIGSIKATRI